MLNSSRAQNYCQQLSSIYSKLNMDYINHQSLGIDADMTVRGSNQNLRPQDNFTIDLNNTWGTQRNKTKLSIARNQLQESSSQKKLSPTVPFNNMYNNQKLKYIIINGNNSKLIRESMKRRPWWIEIPKFNSIYLENCK